MTTPQQPAGGFGYPQPPPPPPPVAPGGQRLAEFTDRLIAYVIDRLILGGATAVVVVPIYLVVFFSIGNDLAARMSTTGPDSTTVEVSGVVAVMLAVLGLILAAVVLAMAFAYIYEVEMMFRTGQTIGKRIMKIRIVPMQPAQTLTRKHAAKRFLIANVAVALVPVLNWVDGLWQLWDKPYRQCLHDKFATTVVVKS